MNIISKRPNPSGAYPPIQDWHGVTPPDTHYEITCDTTEFYNGFIIPTIIDGKMVKYTCNTTLWEAWKKENPEKPTVVPPTVQQLEAKLNAVLQDKAILEECLVEMASIVYA